MDGIRLNDSEALEAFGVNKQKIVEEITRAYSHQIYVDGFFNGDPHPGNFLVSKESPHRPVLLDFGLTKKLPTNIRQALAKMFLASAEGDHVALLSAFAEMGLKFRLDLPEQAMEVTTLFFRSTTPANEYNKTMKSLSDQRVKNMKAIQEKMKLDKKEMKRFNPVDAFPGDIIIFGRVLNLLRGLSSTMNVRIVYMDIMRPFAESVLSGYINRGPSVNSRWIYDTPVHSDVEAKLRQLLIELGRNDKILGIQVCAYKDGEVIIDTAAGMLGKYDPRPVQPDSLFPVFSVTKGIAAGMKFQEILEEAIVRPLNIEGELYVGIPPGNKLSGIAARPDLPSSFQPQQIAQAVSSLSPVMNALNVRRAIIPAANGHMSARALARYYAALADGGKIPPPHSSASEPPLGSHPHIPKFPSQKASKNQKRSKRKKIAIPLINRTENCDENSNCEDFQDRIPTDSSSDMSNGKMADSNRGSNPRTHISGKVFENPRIIDEFLGTGDYNNLALPSGGFGLGFKRFTSEDGSSIVFGHSGMGGSTGFCNVTNKFSIAVTLNKVSIGAVTGKIVHFVCSELNIPVPDDFTRFTAEPSVSDSVSNYEAPLIN
ncbi:putative ABC1 family protein [Senna tora]|uniref:Putative ABC1 family protein n=1 Tax=Senna tora TaxID=362788 RepID=A0A834WBG4_9FABA|nr:putative ABC1 family protein [Senna tora]